MALGFSEAAVKYKDYHAKINELKKELIVNGYTVREDISVESGDVVFSSTLYFEISGACIASLYWNAPYYLDFKSFVDQDEKSFLIDYGGKLNDWNYFVDSIKNSLIKFKEHADWEKMVYPFAYLTKELGKKYRFDIQRKQDITNFYNGSTYCNFTYYKVSDPSQKGLTFSVGVDVVGQIKSIKVNNFHLENLNNDVYGYEDMNKALLSIVSGKFRIRPSFPLFRPVLEIPLEHGEFKAKSKLGTTIMKYLRKGYSYEPWK